VRKWRRHGGQWPKPGIEMPAWSVCEATQYQSPVAISESRPARADGVNAGRDSEIPARVVTILANTWPSLPLHHAADDGGDQQAQMSWVRDARAVLRRERDPARADPAVPGRPAARQVVGPGRRAGVSRLGSGGVMVGLGRASSVNLSRCGAISVVVNNVYTVAEMQHIACGG